MPNPRQIAQQRGITIPKWLEQQASQGKADVNNWLRRKHGIGSVANKPMPQVPMQKPAPSMPQFNKPVVGSPISKPSPGPTSISGNPVIQSTNPAVQQLRQAMGGEIPLWLQTRIQSGEADPANFLQRFQAGQTSANQAGPTPASDPFPGQSGPGDDFLSGMPPPIEDQVPPWLFGGGGGLPFGLDQLPFYDGSPMPLPPSQEPQQPRPNPATFAPAAPRMGSGGPGGGRPTGNRGIDDFIRQLLEDPFERSNPELDELIATQTGDLESAHERDLARLSAAAEGSGRYGSGAFQLARAEQGEGLLNAISQMENQARLQDYNQRLAEQMQALGIGANMDMNDARLAAQRNAASASARAAAGAAASQRELGMAELDLQRQIANQQSLMQALGMQSGNQLQAMQGMGGMAGLYDQSLGRGLNAALGMGDLSSNMLGQQMGAAGALANLGQQPFNRMIGAYQGIGQPMDQFALQQQQLGQQGDLAYWSALNNWQDQQFQHNQQFGQQFLDDALMGFGNIGNFERTTRETGYVPIGMDQTQDPFTGALQGAGGVAGILNSLGMFGGGG